MKETVGNNYENIFRHLQEKGRLGGKKRGSHRERKQGRKSGRQTVLHNTKELKDVKSSPQHQTQRKQQSKKNSE